MEMAQGVLDLQTFGPLDLMLKPTTVLQRRSYPIAWRQLRAYYIGQLAQDTSCDSAGERAEGAMSENASEQLGNK